MAVEIELNKIGKTFTSEEGKRIQAISNLSFQCPQGDFICILGPTGCGKTTLLRLIAGLISPDEGQIRIKGEPLSSINSKAGFVFQQSSLFPWLRSIDNVAFPLRMNGTPVKPRRDQAKAWLQRVNLSGFENAFPHELSGGMVQRVALARALIAEPEILLLDEPFSALDERTRYAAQDLLLRLGQETGATLLFVTHNIEEAVYLGRKILVMASPPQNLVEEITLDSPHPRNRLSDDFIASLLKVRQVFEKIIEKTIGE